MVDSIQLSSSIPLPIGQTLVPIQPPKPDFEVTETEKQDQDAVTARSNDASVFNAYLNQSSISHVTQPATSTHFDPVADLQNSSVYQLPGGKAPL